MTFSLILIWQIKVHKCFPWCKLTKCAWYLGHLILKDPPPPIANAAFKTHLQESSYKKMPTLTPFEG